MRSCSDWTSKVVSYRNSTSNHNGRAGSKPGKVVVSYRNSTSNHNYEWSWHYTSVLYLIEILHQTTTCSLAQDVSSMLYLIEILHQTTTEWRMTKTTLPLYLIEILHQTTTSDRQPPFSASCILSKFYIKPQPSGLILIDKVLLTGCLPL